MSLFAWCTRRAGGLAMFALLALCFWVISQESAASQQRYKHHLLDQTEGSQTYVPPSSSSYTAKFFAYYCLFIHFMTFAFPLRACYAIFDLAKRVEKAAKNKSLRDFKAAYHRRGSATSLSSAETLTSSAYSAGSSETGDVELEPFHDGFVNDSNSNSNTVIHAIIIPNYKEETETLRETLEVLGSHSQALNSYDVYLGMESREPNVELKAGALVQEFAKKFRTLQYTVHPADIAGEAAGKGSNMAWSAREASKNYSLEERQNVVITGIDADSHLPTNYTALITTMHNAYPDTASTTLYSAPIIFDRNAQDVPAVVRVADVLWGSAGLSGLYSGSSIAPPTSVYSVPMVLADRVGGWDVDAEAIGEDLHMYLKCFFALNGNLTSRTVTCAVSQSNITAGKAKGLRAISAGVQARYKQALRHMWGALDSGYAMRKFVELWKERKHTARAFRPLHSTIGDSAHAWTPDNQLGGENFPVARESGVFSDVTHDELQSPDWLRFIYLGHRLFEAHFLPLHMLILVISSTLYVWVAEGNGDPHNIGWTFDLSNVLRTVSFMQVAFWMFLYERFHATCVEMREQEMKQAGLSEGMNFSRRHVKKNWIDYLMIPLVAPLFGSIPALQAQLSHFWTLNLVYTVSSKVTRQKPKDLSAAEQLA